MKILQYLHWSLLASVVGLTASCGSLSPDQGATGVRFHEGAAADVVVRFYGWNSIPILRLDTREDGFLPLLNRESVMGKFDRPDVGRGLAVVIFGKIFTKADEAELIRSWSALFAERGFRRVVLLRAGFKNSIDGLLILHDSAMSATHDEPGKITTTVAALPAAAGANVADSSGCSLW